MTDADWVQQDQEFQLKMARLNYDDEASRRRHRSDRISVIATAVAAVLGILIVVSGLFLWQKSAGERGLQVELACVESGGTWTEIGGGSTTCVRGVSPQ
jgi:hypothetical protein